MKRFTICLSFISLLIFNQANCKQIFATQLKPTVELFFSPEHVSGNIILALYPDNNFDLSIQHYNGTKESIVGTWAKNKRHLKLKSSDTITILYESRITVEKIGTIEIINTTYKFKSSTRKFFASGLDLFELGDDKNITLE